MTAGPHPATIARKRELEALGWQVLCLSNEHLDVLILPEHGGEIHGIRHRSSGHEVLWQAPNLLKKSTAKKWASFDEWYMGGWQTLFPNGDQPCVVSGIAHDEHGESWQHEWDVARKGPNDVKMRVALQTLPLVGRRSIRLQQSSVIVDVEILNAGECPVELMAGEHVALGGSLAVRGSKIDISEATVVPHAQAANPASRLAQYAAPTRWPIALSLDGKDTRLDSIPYDVVSHDVSLLRDMAVGWYAVRNPEARIGLALRYPENLYQWLWMWQAYGGASSGPYKGEVVLGLEPWTSPPNLERAVTERSAKVLGPGESFEGRFLAAIFPASSGRVTGVDWDGVVHVAQRRP